MIYVETVLSLPLKNPPGIEISIISDDHDAADRLRISRLLLSIWQRMKNVEKDAIGIYFLHRTRRQPRVEIWSKWSGEKDSNAYVAEGGSHLNLNWPKLSQLPDWVVESTIAHEMAHILQHATDKSRDRISREDLFGRIEIDLLFQLTKIGLIEIHADEIIIGWGYDPYMAHVWILKHMEFKNGRWKLRKNPWKDSKAQSAATISQMIVYNR